MKKHDTDCNRRVWRKPHLVVDTDIHKIIAAELTLFGVVDAELFPKLLKQSRQIIKVILGDGAYDTENAVEQSEIKSYSSIVTARWKRYVSGEATIRIRTDYTSLQRTSGGRELRHD